MRTNDALDIKIRTLVTELMESAPQAPALPQLEWVDTGKLSSLAARRPGATSGPVCSD